MRIALLVLLTVACRLPFSTEGAQPFDPPATLFAAWYADMETCSGVRGDWGRVRWFSVPADDMQTDDGVYTGYWVSPHRVYLNSEIPFPTNGYPAYSQDWMRLTVRHEMLHDLVGAGHGPVFDRCEVR